MKKAISVMVLLVMVFTGSFSYAGSTPLWTRYTSADGSFSFHYPDNPEGWMVEAGDSAVMIENIQTDEQLLMAMISYDKSKSPTGLANSFITLLKETNPNVRASNWESYEETGSAWVTFDLFDKDSNKQYNGSGIVIKESGQATWFSYIAPASGYSRDRGLSLLEGFMGSLAAGSGSKAPVINYTGASIARIDANAQSFLFILEFALGAPFTESQERAILDELKSGWRSMSEKELSKYDQYPVLVKSILKMGQKDLEKLRSSLEKTTREMIDKAPDSDKAIKIIRAQLQARGKKVIAGNPPLTEMSLAAYSEIIAYSRLLRQNAKALPEQISQESVKEVRKQVQDTWKSFAVKDRQDIATSPGLWICIRTLMKNGTKAEQEKIKGQLLKLTAVSQTSKSSENSGTAGKPTGGATGGTAGSTASEPVSMGIHNSMMAIQQMTFNTYMWSRGFNYLPATGKMW